MSCRKAAALALAVSLWMAGGSVAGAEQKYLYLDTKNSNAIFYTSGCITTPEWDPAAKTLSVTGGNWTGWDIYGGWSQNAGSASGYKLNLKDVSVVHQVIGGYTTKSGSDNPYDVLDNTVTINNSSITGSSSIGMVYGGMTDTTYGNVMRNTVKLTSIGTVIKVYGGYSQKGNATGNTVELTNIGTVPENVYGGYSQQGNASDNTVVLTNSTATDSFGGVYGGYINKQNNTGDATGNTVKLINSKVAGTVFGAYSNSNSRKVTNNTVTIVNDRLSDTYTVGGVYGGNVAGIGTSEATGNTVNLTNANVQKDVYGGNYVHVKGNTLHLSGTNKVGGKVANFETIYIEKAIWGTPVLIQGGNIETVNSISTENVDFSGTIEAGKKTTLIQGGMTGYPADKIKSGKIKIGTTREGTGKASISGNDLIYTVETVTAQEQTHNTVMGAEVGMAALSAGNDFIGAATQGLSLAANTGADGVSSFAQMGGGSIRQETGSHVDVHTWNAILGLGHQNKKERGTMEYGAFFEYGTGNYTTHAENDLRGDGSARYTGGGLLAKYTMRNNVYVEGSLRAGSIHDDARNVMSDGAGNPYSYETNAPYFGFHLGVGKEIALSDGNSVDVYGKYFFNRKNGVSFDAGGHYDLDAVTSSVLRLGARYNVKRDKWNFYGGLAYEHELDGKATGKADGAAIRAADTSGGSLRAEIGATMTPGDNSPWSLDLNLSGFAGKKQGVTGGISVAFMF